jgi:hypothetical protein
MEPKQLTELEVAIKLEEIEREEFQQETLEEAINNFKKTDVYINEIKQKQERMYSEEEVLNMLYKHTEDLLAGKKITLEQWFEQYKKK